MYIYIYIIYLPSWRVRSQGGQKACRPTAPKNGPTSQRKTKGTFQKVQGCPCCSEQARLNLDSHKQWKDICTAGGNVQDPGRNPSAPPDIKVDLLYFRTLQNSFTRKAARDGFCEWQRWFLGSGARLASNPLWFATHALVVFHELLTSVASRPLWFGFCALVVFREMLSSFASKPLWFVPHALVGFA